MAQPRFINIAEIPPPDIDEAAPIDPLTKRHQAEQESYLQELKAALEDGRRVFHQKLRQVHRAHTDQMIDLLLTCAFEENNGGITPTRRHRLAITGRQVHTMPADISDGIEASRRKAAKQGGNLTPVLLLAEAGPIGAGRIQPITRIVMAVDISDALLPLED